MIFGRGGAGGVLNRVTARPTGIASREVALQAGSGTTSASPLDLGDGVNETVALRVTGVYENSDRYRDGFDLERYGVNPTAAFRLGADTTLRGSYEYFHDERTADRGIPSFNGRPCETDPGTFFGDPDAAATDATVNLATAVLEHPFSARRHAAQPHRATATTTSSTRTCSRARSTRRSRPWRSRPTTTRPARRTCSTRPT